MICDLCHKPMPDDMSVFVDLSGTPTLVCYRCEDKADPEWGEEEDDAG